VKRAKVPSWEGQGWVYNQYDTNKPSPNPLQGGDFLDTLIMLPLNKLLQFLTKMLPGYNKMLLCNKLKSYRKITFETDVLILLIY
jgi:hypothetical protein